MFIVDSTILTAELLAKYEQNDENMRKILQFYRKIPLIQRVVSDFVLAEFEMYMTQAVPKQLMLENPKKKELQSIVTAYMRQLIANCTLISSSAGITKQAFSLYQQSNHDSLSFTDCLLLAAAQQYSYTILSHDSKLQDAAKDLHLPFYTTPQ